MVQEKRRGRKAAPMTLATLDRWHTEQLEAIRDTYESTRVTLLEDAYIPAKGTPISPAEAARKYEIYASLLSTWIRRGWVTVLAEGAGPRKTVDEHDVAEVVYNHPGKRGPKPRTDIL